MSKQSTALIFAQLRTDVGRLVGRGSETGQHCVDRQIAEKVVVAYDACTARLKESVQAAVIELREARDEAVTAGFRSAASIRSLASEKENELIVSLKPQLEVSRIALRRRRFRPQEIEDIHQEALVRLLRVDLKQVEELKKYFYTVIMHAAADCGRSLGSCRRLARNIKQEIGDGDVAPGADHPLCEESEVAEVRRCVSQLPKLTREVLDLRWLTRSLTIDEAARELGVCTSTVKRHSERAAAALKRAFFRYQP